MAKTKTPTSKKTGPTIETITLLNGEKRYQVKLHSRKAVSGSAITRRFKTNKEALDFILQAKTDVKNTGKVAKAPKQKHTVEQAIEEYITAHDIPAASVGAYYSAKDILTGRFLISDLVAKPGKQDRGRTLTNLQLWLRELEQTAVAPRGPKGKPSGKLLAASTRRKYYFAVKKSVEWYAEEHNLLLPPDTFKLSDAEIPGAWDDQRDRTPTDQEMQDLLDNADAGGLGVQPDVWQRVILFATQTAMRRQEICLARFKDLRVEGTELYIPRAHVKTKSDRKLPLTAFAVELVEQQKATATDNQERIFWQVKKPNDISEAFASICEKAKIENLHFHDLRHFSTTNLVLDPDMQLPMTAIMQITGHKQMETFKRYVNMRPGALAPHIAKAKDGTLGPKYTVKKLGEEPASVE